MAAAPPRHGVRLTDQAPHPVRQPVNWCGEQGTAGWARVSLPSDVNELSVDERSIASCRLPTPLKNEGATLFSISAQ